MIHLRWRIFINNFVHHLLLFVVALVLLIALCFSLLRFALPQLPQYETLVTDSLSELLKTPVHVETMRVGWHNFEPEVALEGVQIWNEQHQVVMHIPQLDVRLNIVSSLVHRKLALSLLQVRQWKIRLYQNTNNQWEVAGIEQLSAATTSQEQLTPMALFATLLQIKHLKLQACDFYIQPRNGPPLELAQTNLDWVFSGDQLRIYGNTALHGPSNTTLQFSVNLTGDLLSLSPQKVHGAFYVNVDALALAPWLQQYQKTADVHWQAGTLHGALWANWRQNHWQSGATRLFIDGVQTQYTHSQQNPLAIRAKQAAVQINWKDQQAVFSIKATQGDLTLGKIFRTLMPFEQINCTGTWSKNTLGLNKINLSSTQIKTTEAELIAQLTMTWSETIAAEMNLLARAHFNQLDSVAHYLPAGIMAPSLTNWLDQAIVHAQSLDAELWWRGPLSHFPFHDQAGTMQIVGSAHDVTLNYAPEWPLIRHLNADLFFTSHGLHLLAKSGLLGDLPIAQVTADIPFTQKTNLSVHGVINTELDKAWSFLTQSKLKHALSFLLTQTKAQGPAQLNLALTIPLYADAPKITYQGFLSLAHDQVSLIARPIDIHELSGVLRFDDQSLQSTLEGSWFNQPWHFVLAKAPNAPQIHLDFVGVVPVDSWIKQYASWAADWLSGLPTLNGHVIISSDQNKMVYASLESDLKGLALHLPLDINKKIDAITPLSINITDDNLFNIKINWSGLENSVIQAAARGSNWSITTPKGSVKIIAPHDHDPVWAIHLADMDLRALDHSLIGQPAEESHIPAMNIDAANVMLPTVTLQTAHVELRPSPQGLLIKNMTLNPGSFTITAEGSSGGSDDQDRYTHLQGYLVTANLANALTALGFNNLIDATQTRIGFALSWPGALWQFDRNQLTGTLNVHTGPGVFKDVSAQTNNRINLGRMLSFLSLSDLPQRLSAHFNDMTQKGFPFSQLSSQLGLMPNRLNPIHAEIKGPVADVLLQGCLNTKDRRVNLLAEINPNLTGSLPVLAAFAGGPILGAIGLVANQLLEPMVGKISASYYSVQGSEQNPTTDKINNIKAAHLLKDCPI